jgi:hypothetical protein
VGSVYKLHVHRWAEQIRCNSLILSQVQSIATGTGRVFQLMNWVRRGDVDRLLPAPPSASDWLPLYEDHRRITMALADHFPQMLGRGPEAMEGMDLVRAATVWARTDREGFEEWLSRQGMYKLSRWIRTGLTLAHREYKRHLKSMREDLAGQPGDDDRDFGAMLKQSSELYFYFRVVLPCMCTHQKYPAMLLRKARRASNATDQAKAIESLVRVDRYVVVDPSIERWINGHDDGTIRRIRQQQVERWKATGIDGRFSKMQVYELMGGLIWTLVHQYGSYWSLPKLGVMPGSITAAQIRDLFFAVEKDCRRLGGPEKGEAMALPDGFDDLELESWRKAITRHGKRWEHLLKNKGGQKSP